ncbi:MAG: hypothetical protein AB7O56_12265 [Bauldia sp.]
MNATLKELIAKIETWPERAQAEAILVLKEIERELKDPGDYALTVEDRAAIAEGLADVRAGRLHSLDEIRALVDAYRTK